VGPGEPGWDDLPRPGRPQALVVVPTRELAVQVAGDLTTASRHRSVRILQVYGGRAYEPQVEALRAGIEIVVGTPGRMIDLMRQRALELGDVSCVVLDEADEMLDLGFLPDVETLIGATAAARHTMLFSATMPGAVVALARRYMSRPTHIRAHDPHDEGITLKSIKQVVYRAHSLDKIEILARLLQAEGRGLTIVFVRTKRTAARVAEDLAERGFAAAAIHGDLGQGAREQALRAFRNGKVDVLVATDVAARGIDVENVTHVVNYQCPEDEKTYLHRTGRTGRAGNTGTAVTLVDWDDMPRWALIDKALGLGQPEPPETYSTSPHVYADLNIPAGTRGVLPRGDRTRAGLAAEELEDLGETGKARRPARSAPRPDAAEGSGGGRAGDRGAGTRRRGAGGSQARGRDTAGAGQHPAPAAGQHPAPAAERVEATAEPTAGSAAGASAGEGRRRSRNRRRTRGGRPAGSGNGTGTD
jgi:superfamily II DNA/RNA helicase